MALRAVPDHPKFADLKRRLGFGKAVTLGYLEAIWHFAGRFTPQGNLGKYTDGAIEAWLEWDGEPGALIAALVDSGWIDPDKTHRLLVHDWAQHADKATKQALNRAKLEFCVPTVHTERTQKRVLSALPVPEPVPVPEPEPAPEPARANGNGNHRPPDPNFEVWAEAAYARHPKKADKFLALKALHETFAGHPNLQRTFDKHHEFMCKTPEWREKHGRFAPRLHEWILNDGWRSPPEDSAADEPEGIRYLRELAKGVSGEA